MKTLIEISHEYFDRLSRQEHKLKEFLHSNYLPPSLNPGLIASQLDQHIYGRSRFFLNSILPWINDFKAISNVNVVEIGPGTGATTAPLAMAVNYVHAYDISTKSSDVAKYRCEILEISNVNISASDPDSILTNILAKHRTDPPDIILMFAVLEHQTLPERLQALSTCWEILSDDGLLVIGDTPNRLTYQHGHTSRIPFFDMVPDSLMAYFMDQSPNEAFAQNWLQWKEENLSLEKIGNSIDRWGRGVSFHEFLAAIGPLEDIVLADGLERRLVRAMPISIEDNLLMKYLAQKVPSIPLGFGRQSLYLILSKKGNVKNFKKWDEDLVRGLLAYS